jgi:Ca2+-binding EF-hand superfamily protein
LSENKGFFGCREIAEVMKKMEMIITNAEIDRMVWEFDEDLDKQISL